MCFETCLPDPRHFYRCTLCRCYFSLDSLPQTSALSGCGEQKLSHPSSHRVEVRWSHENKEMSKNIYSMNWYTRLCMSLWFSGLSKYPKNKDLTVKHHIKLTGRPTDWLADRLYDRLSDCPIDRLSDWLIDRLPDLPIDRPTDRTVNWLTNWLIGQLSDWFYGRPLKWPEKKYLLLSFMSTRYIPVNLKWKILQSPSHLFHI